MQKIKTLNQSPLSVQSRNTGVLECRLACKVKEAVRKTDTFFQFYK